jgi:2-hydroxychromene-2-carboxylate isomerase
MRITSILRTAAFALALAAPTGLAGVAFADDGIGASAQHKLEQNKAQDSSRGVYDAPEFVLPLSQTFG